MDPLLGAMPFRTHLTKSGSGGTKRATFVNMPLLRLQSSEGKFTMCREIEPVRRPICRHGSCTFTEVARLVPSGPRAERKGEVVPRPGRWSRRRRPPRSRGRRSTGGPGTRPAVRRRPAPKVQRVPGLKTDQGTAEKESSQRANCSSARHRPLACTGHTRLHLLQLCRAPMLILMPACSVRTCGLHFTV